MTVPTIDPATIDYSPFSHASTRHLSSVVTEVCHVTTMRGEQSWSQVCDSVCISTDTYTMFPGLPYKYCKYRDTDDLFTFGNH